MEPFSIFLFSFTISFAFATAADTMVVNQTIRDGQTIVSAQQTFELGFFSPSNTSENRYLGIWYKQLATDTVVWVANRETPIRNKTGELTLHDEGVLVLRNSPTNQIVWSSDSSRTTGNFVAQLLDTGNLMVIDDGYGPENYIWQSFDHPGDTQLPAMKFGRNWERGVVTNFTSWKSVDDPSQGPLMVYMDFNGLPQVFTKNEEVIQSRLGSWNGLAFTGWPRMKANSYYTVEYVSNEREIYFKFDLINSSVLTKSTLTAAGNMGRFIWINRTQGWFLLPSPMTDNCVQYALCGPYGSCDIERYPPCGCLKGFTLVNVKGILEDGREVAVKRLSESSTQGVEEFKNEVIFISKLQHRNLVKILGCSDSLHCLPAVNFKDIALCSPL